MSPTYAEFVLRADAVRAQIAAACAAAGRDPTTVELLAVTKTHPVAAADFAARYGLHAVGENRVQEAAEKRPLCAAPALAAGPGVLKFGEASYSGAEGATIQVMVER